MHVKDSRAGVVAINGLLHLLIHANRDVVRIGRQPLGPVGRYLDHKLFLVFRQERVIEEMHGVLRLFQSEPFVILAPKAQEYLTDWDIDLPFWERYPFVMPYLARSQILTGFAPLARSLGLAPERLVKIVGLDLASLNDLDSRISATAFADLLERSAEAAKIEDFGLRLAESRDLGILGPIGIVIHQEPDLRFALHSLIRYLPVHNESLALRLEDERGIAMLALEVRSFGLDRVRQVTELSLGAFFRILRRLAGPQWKPHRIC